MVDEHLAGPLGDVPFHGDIVGIGGDQQPAHPLHQLPDPGVGVDRHDRDVDVEAGGAGGLGVADQTEAIEGHLHQSGHRHHLLPGGPLGRVEVEDGEVRVLDPGQPGQPGMDLDAAHVGQPHQRLGIAGGHEVDGLAPGPGVDGRQGHPVGLVAGRLLLVEEPSLRPVGESGHDDGPIGQVWEQDRRNR